MEAAAAIIGSVITTSRGCSMCLICWVLSLDSVLTGCKFSVAQMLRSSAQIEGNRIRRERCVKKKVWDSEPVQDTDMRVSAMFSDPCAADALTARGSVFSHAFKGLE